MFDSRPRQKRATASWDSSSDSGATLCSNSKGEIAELVVVQTIVWGRIDPIEKPFRPNVNRIDRLPSHLLDRGDCRDEDEDLSIMLSSVATRARVGIGGSLQTIALVSLSPGRVGADYACATRRVRAWCNNVAERANV